MQIRNSMSMCIFMIMTQTKIKRTILYVQRKITFIWQSIHVHMSQYILLMSIQKHTLNRTAMDEMEDNLMFSKCHEPYYNVLPLSFKLSRVLTDFIPVRHIVKRILIPYVGYNLMHCNEQEDIEYVTDEYFEELMSQRGSSHSRRCHILEENGKVYDKDIVLLSVDGYEYVDLSNSEDEEYGSTTSDHSSYFFDLFGSESDDW
eukprot:168175_1